MHDVLIDYTPEGREIWVDYSWLYKGCTDETYFKWMFSLFTAQNPDIREMHKKGMQFRRFVAEDGVGWTAHNKRIDLVDVEKFDKYSLTGYIQEKGWNP